MKNLHVIVGLGATGYSCAQYLFHQNIPFAVTDTRAAPPHLEALQKMCPDAMVSLGKLDEALLDQAFRIIISPGMPLSDPIIARQIARGVQVIGDVELFAEAVKAPVIAITGTNAKSTVTTLVGEMAKEAGYTVETGGNLGIPVLDLLADQPDASLFVLELSSFQLETTYSLKPLVATILNITPDHLDRYDSYEDYQRAKHRVYLNCQTAVCNLDDSLTDTDATKKIYFTLGKPSQKEFGLTSENNVTFLSYGNQPLMPISELPVPGKHYQANALAALAIGLAAGFSFEPMLKVLREFKGLPHRCQLVRELHGVKWYNDSKGTNIGASQAAIEGLGSEIPGKLVLIAGGVGKDADFATLAPAIEKYSRHVVLIGKAAKEIADALGNSVPYTFATDMDNAVSQAAAAARQGDSVLLSPACASFDMFKNFEHRGDVFTEIVNKLSG